MLIVVLWDVERFVQSNDFQSQRLNKLISTFDAKLLICDVESVVDTLCIPLSELSCVYIASYCVEIKSVYRAMDDLAKSCKLDSMKFVLIQDLIRTERHYIYSNQEANFFRNFLKLSSLYSNVTSSITNSNILCNSWGEEDTEIHDIPEIIEHSEEYWQNIKQNVKFYEMFNQGNAVPRLVSIQSVYQEGMGRPLYRHPNDEEPPNEEMIPEVLHLMGLVEKYTGVTGLNHALIQHYRHGRDNIAAHSDKTLDIDLNTPIINLSIGVDRVMSIQNKTDKQRIEKIPLSHGQCVVFGLRTNRYWFHEVAKDIHITPHSLFGQERISFTFRKIATFVNDQGVIVGQGSPFKTAQDVPSVAAECSQTRSDLITAFSAENRQAEQFDWNAVYGGGFLVR